MKSRQKVFELETKVLQQQKLIEDLEQQVITLNPQKEQATTPTNEGASTQEL